MATVTAYIDGTKVPLQQAAQWFRQYCECECVDPLEIDHLWSQCLKSEDARDCWLPASLELVVS